jgi:hypothetical protein
MVRNDLPVGAAEASGVTESPRVNKIGVVIII